MRAKVRKPCKVCGKLAFPPDRTKLGNHIQCSISYASESTDSLRAKRGECWQRYEQAMEAHKATEAARERLLSLKSRRSDGVESDYEI